MNKFLLIDDDSSRLNDFRDLFNFIDVDYLEDGNDFFKYIDKQYDGYIIDVVLDGRDSRKNNYIKLSFQTVIDNIPDNKPIFIVSSNWQDVMNGETMNLLVQSEKYKNILGYFSWSLISKDEKGLHRNFAKTQLNNFEGIRIHEIEKDADLTILQISDLEFGNPEQEDFINSHTQDMVVSIRSDLNKLSQRKQKVDMIVVCGDIAHTGKSAQYLKASEWLNSFCKQILKGSIKENIIFVPGNHDFDIDSTLQNNYYFDFKSKSIKKRNPPINDYVDLGFVNYFKFIYDFTGNSSLLLNPKHYYLNKSLRDANIVFVQIFPIEYSAINGKFKYCLSDNDIAEIVQELSELSNDITCIMISHVSYQAINMIDPTSGAVSKEIENFIKLTNVKIWMYGHAHAPAKIDDIDIGGKKRLISNSDSLLLTPVARCPGSTGGYTLLNLKRSNGKVVSAEYLKDGKIKSKDEPFE